MRNYLRLLAFIKGHRALFAMAVAAMLISSLFKVFELSLMVPLSDRILNDRQIVLPNAVPSPVQSAVDRLNALDRKVLFHWLPFVVLLGMIFKHGFIYCHQFLMNDVAQRVMRDVRQRLYVKIQNLSLDYFSERRTGELMSRITNDVGVIENAVSYGVTDLFVQTFSIVGFVSMAFMIHRRAAVIVFFVFPFIVWPMSQIGKKLRKLARQTQERMADINSLLLETISGIREVKAFCTEDYEIRRFSGKNHDFYKLRMKAVRRLLWLPPITEIFGTVCGIVLILWLGRQVMDGGLSFGIFIVFFAYVMSIISPVKKLGNVNALTQQALSASERIYAILDAQPSVVEKPDAVELPAIREGIALEDVFFRYDKEGPWVIEGIRLRIRVGELVAIVGPTGTGKSTLANLIPRFYDPVRGAVSIDGTDLRDVTFRSLRRQIGIVSQETFLFNDTVRANIAYGCRDVSRERIEAAAEQAYAHKFISSMPKGYDTVIGDRGFRLSGGEKQRIAIARAILHNPPILILDEATSQLDSESERYVQEALDTLMRGRTVIAIAHRLSTIKKADAIVVLERGRIVGRDRHEALLESCDLYRRLYETQFHS